ncbi:MAG: hypothetical protein M0P13_11695 [Fibrobacteraceae bacterium]|nr:hypothetical protein [Fibrobacteraceae bacterium]
MKKLPHSESEIVNSVKELEDENAKLKRMYANLALDNEILREVIEKNLGAESRGGRTCSCRHDISLGKNGVICVF